jgi:hypothetical protein
LTIDGIAVQVGDRVLVKNELGSGTACNGNINSACDGIYTVQSPLGDGSHPYILLRSGTLNTKGNAENVAAGWPGGDSVLVTAGTANAGTTWINTANIATLNLTAFLFTQITTLTSSPWQVQGSVIYYPKQVEVGPIEGPGFGWLETNNDGVNTSIGALTSISTGYVGGTIHINQPIAYNYFQIQTDQTGADSPFGEAIGHYIFMQTGGPLEGGSKVALKAFLQHSVATPVNANKGDHGAIEATAYGTANDGGTALLAAGTLYGMSAAGISDSGATFLSVVSGGEIHADMRTGSSGNHRWGWSMVSAGNVNGTISDAAIEIGGSPASAEWQNAIFMNGFHGGPALTTTGCVICVDATNPQTIATGMDLAAYTITGNFLKSNGFLVSGSGFAGINGADFGQSVYYDWAQISVSNGLNSNVEVTAHSAVRIVGPTGAFSVGGFIQDFGSFSGQILHLYNTVSQPMTIVNEDLSSTAGNRIKTLTGGNVTLRSGPSFASFIYDLPGTRWVLMSTN